jgi:beta-glucosidase
VLNFEPKHPATGHPLDQEAAVVAHDQFNRWYLDPIAGGGYPEEGARAWGWRRDEVLEGDMAAIAAPIDFLGVNYYCRNIVRSALLPALGPPPEPAERTAMGWEVYPAGLTEVLEFVASRTGDLPLYVTENGAAYPPDDVDTTRDPERVSFLRRHLEAAATAIGRGVPLHGYLVWSLLDNFEWAHGYGCRFGIVHVDFDTLERRVRDSGRFWADVARSGVVPADAQAPSSP